MTHAELTKLSAETGEATPIDLGDTLLFQDGNARAAAELILDAIPEIAAAWEKAEKDREGLLAACNIARPLLRKMYGIDAEWKAFVAAIAQAEETRWKSESR